MLTKRSYFIVCSFVLIIQLANAVVITKKQPGNTVGIDLHDREKMNVYLGNLLNEQANKNGGSEKTDDIPANLFKPVVAETEKPILLATVPPPRRPTNANSLLNDNAQSTYKANKVSENSSFKGTSTDENGIVIENDRNENNTNIYDIMMTPRFGGERDSDSYTNNNNNDALERYFINGAPHQNLMQHLRPITSPNLNTPYFPQASRPRTHQLNQFFHNPPIFHTNPSQTFTMPNTEVNYPNMMHSFPVRNIPNSYQTNYFNGMMRPRDDDINSMPFDSLNMADGVPHGYTQSYSYNSLDNTPRMRITHF